MLTTRRARREIAGGSEERREAVRQELEAVAAAQITDVVTWTTREDGTPRVSVTPSDQLSERARRGVKKIKVTPGPHGDTLEIEMHDKLSALRILARAEGLLESVEDQARRPSLVGINLKGPATETPRGENEQSG